MNNETDRAHIASHEGQVVGFTWPGGSRIVWEWELLLWPKPQANGLRIVWREWGESKSYGVGERVFAASRTGLGEM